MNKVTRNIVEGEEPALAIAHVRNKPLGSAAAVAQSIGAKFVIIAIGAATGIISARALQPAGRGELAAMILWPVFLASALTLGVPSALTFQLRRNPERQSELMGAALLVAVLTGGLAALGGILLMPLWLAQYSERTVLFSQIFLLSTPLTSLSLVARAGFESRGDFGASNKILIWTPALTLLTLLSLLGAHLMTPYTAAAAYAPVGIVPLTWIGRRLWRIFRPSLKSFPSSAKLLFSYGIRSYGVDLCGTMALYIDQALVVCVLQPKMMGIYVVALSLSRMLSLAFHTSVATVLFPKAVSQSPDIVRALAERAARLSTLLTTLAGLAVVSFGPQMLALLYGADYRGATPVLRILVLEVVLAGAALVLSQAFMALGRPGVITGLQIIGLLLTIPFMLLLVPRFGIVGAAVALFLSTTIRLIFVLASFPLFLNMRVPQILPTWADVRFLAGTIWQHSGLLLKRQRLVLEQGD
jgi:O-antigen/teichoic acid export membrane protein